MIVDKLDYEFKMFLRWRGFNIDTQLFDLKLNEPQNFAQHRQVEIDAARINVFGQLEQVAYFSKRFLMKRYLGLTEEEMTENEQMWLQEQGEVSTEVTDSVGLRSVGITPGAISGDLEVADQISAAGTENLGAAGAAGAEVGAGAVPAGAAASPIGGAAPAGVPAAPTGLPQ